MGHPPAGLAAKRSSVDARRPKPVTACRCTAAPTGPDICGDRDGRYGYLGRRLSDDAVLKKSARTTPTPEFVAHNESITYSISSAELRVTVGGAVIKQEPMIDYRGPGT